MVLAFKKSILLIPLVLNSYAIRCQLVSSLKPGNAQNVGDIDYLPFVDDARFETGKYVNLPQYYEVKGGYEGGRKHILREFKKKFNDESVIIGKQDSGYITIRFVISHEGKSGRFRILQINKGFKPTSFNIFSLRKLYDFTKGLKAWRRVSFEGRKTGYYQYLTFVIDHGKVVDILP